MSKEKDWLRFIISGRVDDYIRYTDSVKKESLNGGEKNSFHNGCSCNKGEQYRG